MSATHSILLPLSPFAPTQTPTRACPPASRGQDSGLGDGEDGSDDNSTWVFNTFAVFGFLALLIVCHILLLSYMEASWLSQVHVYFVWQFVTVL